MVIINQDTLKQKINTFIQENHITCLNKDPTHFSQKQIQQAIKKCDILKDKCTHKYIMNITPMALKLKVCIITHKENESIRPIIKNIQATPYKITKYLNKRLNNLICLPYT